LIFPEPQILSKPSAIPQDFRRRPFYPDGALKNIAGTTGKEMKMSDFTKAFASAALVRSLILAAVPAMAESSTRCDTLHVNGSTQQFAPDTPFVGSVTLLNLATGEARSADVSTALLGYTDPAEGRVITSHEIHDQGAPRIDLVTFDEAQLVPTGAPGVFSLASRMQVKTGTGAYNCGEIVLDPGASTVSFDLEGLGSADYSGLGRLCRCRPADN
jgi:hypothetical protein